MPHYTDWDTPFDELADLRLRPVLPGDSADPRPGSVATVLIGGPARMVVSGSALSVEQVKLCARVYVGPASG
jgi:hypothetical protein